MRLHLPKALLAAVLAACLAWPAGAEGEDTPTPTTVTVTQQSDLTSNYQLTTAVSSLGAGDLLIFNAPGKIYLPDGSVAMPMDIEFKQDFLIQNGFGSKTYTFSGALISEAGITATMTPDVQNTYSFSGNLESFKGSLVFNNKITANFQNVGTVGAKSISLAGSTTLTGNFSTSGNLTNTGTLTNRGTLTIGGSYTGGTITQDSSASLVLSKGSIVNLDSIAATNNLTNTGKTGVQACSKSWTLVSRGSLTDNGARYKLGGNDLTDGSMSLPSGTFTSATSYYYYNVASGTSRSYSEVTTEIGTTSVDLINVLGNLTGVSNSTLRHTIDGSGVVQVDTNDTLSYSTFTAKKASTFTGTVNVLGILTGLTYNNNITGATIPPNITGTGIVQVSGLLEYGNETNYTFLNDFSGILEITSGGDLRLGQTTTQLGNLTKVKVLSGGYLRGYSSARPATDLELAGGTLDTAGGDLIYSGEIIVTESSSMGAAGKKLTLTNTVKAENGVITTNGTVKHTGGFDLSGNGNVYTGTLLIESGSFESAGNMLGTSNEQHKTTIQMKEGKSFKKGDFTFTGKSNTDSIITFGKTGTFGVGDAHTVDNTSVTYAGSADATDATILGMNLGNGSTLTVTSGKLKVSGTNKLASINLNGGETTLTGSTEVTGTTHGGVVNGVVAANDDITLTVSGILKHNDFKYEGSKLSGLSNGLSMWNDNGSGNVSVTGGTVEQIGGTGKDVYAALKDVKLINALGKETRLYAGAELSGASIGGTLRVGRDDLTWNPDTQQNDIRVLKEVTVTVSGQADVTGEVKIETGSTFELTGQDTTSSIAKLTGSGTLKTTGDETSVTNASRFSGTLEATGGSLTANGTTTGDSGDVILGSLSGLKATGGSIVLEEVAPTLTITDLVVAGNGSISGAESYTANKVSIGAGEAGSLVGNLSIQDGGTITLDASAGATTETGGTKGLLLSALTTFADEGTTTTTGSLTLGSGLTLNLANLGRLAIGDSLTLFSGVTSAVYGDNATELTADGIEANTVFSNLTAGDFKLSYSNNIVALVAQRDTPEPTTATLSLLALMALAARRRRKA